MDAMEDSASSRSTASRRVRAYDLTRYVGRCLDGVIDGQRHSCKVIAVGTGGVSLTVESLDRRMTVPTAEVGALHLTVPSFDAMA